MRVLTVQNPWAWAIIFGGKSVENRTTPWAYRGPLAIHAGSRLSERGCNLIPDLLDQTRPDLLATYAETDMVYGAIIGTVNLIDVHIALPELRGPSMGGLIDPACCESPWAEQSYVEHGGRTRRELVHLVLSDPVPVEPIPCKGRLGLWSPDVEILTRLSA